ncbi:MAG: hypothetical protein K2H10_03060, partial [Bacteroidales bacterium]|nr:hypothetical protein [Bacteroidales bacterium]
ETEKEMIDALAVLAREGQVRTITSDNGLQFANHQTISRAWGADFYFAKPYHSWKRGTNENTNGLINRYGVLFILRVLLRFRFALQNCYSYNCQNMKGHHSYNQGKRDIAFGKEKHQKQCQTKPLD